MDEIHRWNKAQQDALLPFVENGTITLLGATTENPSFSINAALLSRCRVFVLEKLSLKDICKGLQNAYKFLSKEEVEFKIKKKLEYIARLSQGDIRYALNALEILWNQSGKNFNTSQIEEAAQKSLLYDKSGEQHYNLISAVHKSLRSGNASAGIYWIARMLRGGEDPLYIARRLIRFASEDIGNANPNALLLANQVYETVQKIGMPECAVSLVQLAEFLANSPKNNSAYLALKQAFSDVDKFGSLEVPLHFRNAPTELMKELGYGKDYEYDHDLENKKSNQQCFPPELQDRDYFEK